METGFKRFGVWIFVCLLSWLVACDGELNSTAVPPAQTTSAEPTETAEPLPLSQIGTVPTDIFISQFPVSLIGTASAQRPAFISIEMAGFNVSELSWQIGRYEGSCNRLVAMGLIAPNDSSEGATQWLDGAHQADFSWPAVDHFLSDGESGGFVQVQATSTIGLISGRYRSALSGEVVAANLLMDLDSADIVGLQTPSGESLTAAAGDGFQLFQRCLESDGTIRSVPGIEIRFFEGGQLNLTQEPLPSGDFFLHLTASGPENSVSSTTDFPVDNDTLVPDREVYLDTDYGFQFLYPAGWSAPQAVDTRVITGDDSTSLTVTTHPDLAGKTPSDLKNQALAQFGNVPILFEDQISIGDAGALWTAYGYTGNDGSHTGILLTFIKDDIGYTIDLDGLETAEAQTISQMNALAESWLFRPDITALRALEWTTVAFDGLLMPVKANYYQEELDNGWRRFTVGDGMSFMAVRTEALAATDMAGQIDRWIEVASREVADFAVSDHYPFSLNGREWTRADFAYEGEGELRIQGAFLVAEVNGGTVIYWIEIPETRYEEQTAEFLLSLAGLR